MSPVETLLAEVACDMDEACDSHRRLAVKQAKALREWLATDATLDSAAHIYAINPPDGPWLYASLERQAKGEAEPIIAALADLIGGAR